MQTHSSEAEKPDDAVEGVGNRFEAVWSSGRPQIEDYLLLVDPTLRNDLLELLLRIDISQRRQRGETPELHEYVNRLPAYAERMWQLKDAFKEPPSVNNTLATYVATSASATAIEHPTDRSPIDQTIATDIKKTVDSSHSVVRRDDEANERIFGDYELTDQLGEGGMGVVWKARQMNAGGRFVALKLIRPDKLSNYHESERATVLARFQNESKAAAQLDHDHITTVYDVGEIEGQPYFAMKFVDGKSLADLIKDKTLSNRQAANYCRHIALALAAAHEAGVLHRDLKPHNVMVETNSDRALLTDFGLAKISGDDSALTIMDHQVVFGSPPYMSPEQAEHSGKVSPAADIYGLGATLYHALAGRPPFQAPTPRETLKQVAEHEPPMLRLLNPGVDRDLETICHKALDKLPEKRYQSAQELAAELGRYLNGEPILARRITRVEKVWRWCKRNPTVASLITLCVLAILLGVTGSTWFGIQMQAEAARADLNASISKEKERKAVAARTLADSRLYRTLVSRTELFVNSREIGDIGWSWGALKDLNEASAIDSPDRDDYLVRSLKAKVLNTIDVRKVGEIRLPELPSKQRGEIADVAFGDDGKTIFVAELKGTPDCRVVGFDAASFKGNEAHFLNTANPLEMAFRLAQGRNQTGFRSVAASPDGRWLACGTRYGNVEIWDRKSPGEPVQRLEVLDGFPVNVIVFSKDSRALFATAHDNVPAEKVRVQAFELIDEWAVKKTITGLGNHFCLSNNGKTLAVCKNDATTLLDAHTLETIDVVDPVHGVPCFSADDRFLVGHLEGYIYVYDIETRVIRSFLTNKDYAGGDQIHLFGDTLLCATSSYANEGVRIYDLLHDRNSLLIPTAGVSRAKFTVSPDGSRIAVAGKQSVVIFEVRLPMTKRRVANPNIAAVDLEFSPDSNQLSVLFEDPRDEVIVSSNYLFHTENLKVKQRSSSWINSNYFVGESPQEFRKPVFAFDAAFSQSFNVERLMGPTFRKDLKVHDTPGAIPTVLPKSIVIPVNKPLPVVNPNTPENDLLSVEYSAVGNPQLQTLGESEAFQVIVNLRNTTELPSGCWFHTELANTTPMDGRKIINAEQRIMPLSPGHQSYCSGLLVKSHSDSKWRLRLGLLHKHAGEELVNRIQVESILLSAKIRSNRVTTKTRVTGPVAMSPAEDQVWAVVDADRLVSWKYPTGKFLYEYSDVVQKGISGNSGVLAIALMGDKVLVGSRGGALVLLNRLTGKYLSHVAGPGGEINCVEAVSQTQAVVATDSGKLAHFDISTGELSEISRASSEIVSCSVSNGGEFIAFASGKSVFILQRGTGRWRRYLEHGPFEHQISCVEISPNGRYLAYGFDAAKTAAHLFALRAIE